jgi:hypothetical protein
LSGQVRKFSVEVVMPALFAYMIAVALLLGGGYGALNWLATPEPVKVAAKSRPQPPAPHFADDAGASTQASPPTSDQPLPTPALPQPQPPAIAGAQDARAGPSKPATQPDRSAQAEMPLAATAKQAGPAATPASGTVPDHSAPATHEDEKQATLAVSSGTAASNPLQSAAAIAPIPAAMTPRRSHVRQASRRSEKRPLEVMTLRTIELPDGRRMTRLVPYGRGNRYRDGGPAMAFDPDE